MSSAASQTFDEIRQDLSESLRQAKFAASLGSLILLGEELELSGGRLEVDSDGTTDISTLVLPFSTHLSPFERDDLGLYVEGVLGHTRAEESIDDLYLGQSPAIATSVDAEWTSISAFGGIGPDWRITDELRVTPVLSFGVAYLESDADYGGPGADPTAQVFDGIAFNWEAWTLNYGGSLRVDWVRELSERRSFRLIGRYDARWTDVIESDDPAQDFTSRLQLGTVRAEYRAPTGWSAGTMPVDFRLRFGARRFLEGDLFGAQQVYEAGGTLELLTGDRLPLATGIQLNGAVFFSDDISGWTAGLGLSF